MKIEDGVDNPIQVSCIAGPFFGSKLANKPDWSGKAQKRWKRLLKTPLARSLSDETIEELSWGSARSKKVVEKMHIAAKNHNVRFDFYATWADPQVTPFTSALPRNVLNARYYLVQNEGHSSIVKATRKQVVTNTKEFLEKLP